MYSEGISTGGTGGLDIEGVLRDNNTYHRLTKGSIVNGIKFYH